MGKNFLRWEPLASSFGQMSFHVLAIARGMPFDHRACLRLQKSDPRNKKPGMPSTSMRVDAQSQAVGTPGVPLLQVAEAAPEPEAAPIEPEPEAAPAPEAAPEPIAPEPAPEPIAAEARMMSMAVSREFGSKWLFCFFGPSMCFSHLCPPRWTNKKTQQSQVTVD